MARYTRPKRVVKQAQQARSGKSHVFEGITFSSGLELYMWKALKVAGIKAEYESEKFSLMSPFILKNEVWERKANGKGDMLKKTDANIRGMMYTPDFIIRKPNGTIHMIIETKGYANESFPLRWKLFKQVVHTSFPDVVLFKPQKQTECDFTVQRILQLQNDR